MRRRVTVVVLSVCVCVSVKSHLTSGASVLPENTVTHSAAMEVKKFVGFSLKPLRCRDPALPPLTAIHTVGHFPADSTHAHYSISPRVLHFSAYGALYSPISNKHSSTIYLCLWLYLCVVIIYQLQEA